MKNGPFPLPPPSATSLRANPRLPTLVRGSEQPEHPMADPAGTPAPSSANGIALTFPDGARREYPQGTTGLDIAKGISPSLAERTVAMALDRQLADLSDPIGQDATLEFVSRDDPRALELIRHDAAHVLAEAVQALWPGTQVTIGPVIENGFYYDFA